MNTYGDLPNASLLHMYGFAEVQNPHDEAGEHYDITQCYHYCRPSYQETPSDSVYSSVVMIFIPGVGPPLLSW